MDDGNQRRGWSSDLLEHLFVLTEPSNNAKTTAVEKDSMDKKKSHHNQEASNNILTNPNSNVLLQSHLYTSLGGMRPQIEEIVRRVLDGRVFVPYNNKDDEEVAEEDVIEEDTNKRLHTTTSSSTRKQQRNKEELTTLWDLGIKPVRGLLLYGKPGCGKTLLARELSRIIHARPPKIVSAPDLLDKWIGGTEAMVRELFVDAEEELRYCQGDFTQSSLHVIVIDECDALFRKRSAASTASEVTRASAVNQILAKLDGVQQLDNVLLIAMTNRKDLLDPALLRPGRLEVQIECPLPNEQGRREILQIRLNGFRLANRLSQPLFESIYGGGGSGTTRNWPNDQSQEKDNQQSTVEMSRRRRRVLSTTSDLGGYRRRFWPRIAFFSNERQGLRQRHTSKVDLALDRYTGGFSGADLAGLVRCAGSRALARWRQQHSSQGGTEGATGAGVRDPVLDGLIVTTSDFLDALDEVKIQDERS